MNYPPKHYQDNNKDHMIEVIKMYPLATLISVKNEEPFITHLPLIYEESSDTLLGHIDRFNPQAALLEDHSEVTIIFSGPQCYISPSIYTTTQLPTWNYIKVHLKGIIHTVNDTNSIKDNLIKMTSFLEQPEHKYVLEPNNPRMENALSYIKSFEITMTQWEGKFKLSQDKKKQDRDHTKTELIKANQKSIEPFLNRIS